MGHVAASGDAADISVAWFGNVHTAHGEPETLSWLEFAGSLLWRRSGPKDGICFCPSRFTLEQDGQHVRRKLGNVAARTAIALDCEPNKATGELPPSFAEAVKRVRSADWAAVLYTSHSHRPGADRYRVVLPITAEIAPGLPAVEIIAERLGLTGVLDRSKLHAASVFYTPSTEPGAPYDHHRADAIDGAPIDAVWLREAAGAVLAEREAEQARQAEAAHREAEERRQAKIAAGFDPDDSLIEKLRCHFDLAGVLLSHGYDKSGAKFRHPNSSSGSFGADIKTFGGIERVFSHNATDPLHAANLPPWCGGVTALDAVDATIILDFGGNRTKALAELAQRFGLTKAEERKKLAALIFRLIRKQAAQEEIEAAAYAEGERLGLSRAEVVRVAQWVASQATAELPGAGKLSRRRDIGTASQPHDDMSIARRRTESRGAATIREAA